MPDLVRNEKTPGCGRASSVVLYIGQLVDSGYPILWSGVNTRRRVLPEVGDESVEIDLTTEAIGAGHQSCEVVSAIRQEAVDRDSVSGGADNGYTTNFD